MPVGVSAQPRLRRWWESALEPVLAVAFPPRCVGCGEFEVYLCARCRAGLSRIGAESCGRCGEPGVRPLVAGRCSTCMGRETDYVSARSAFRHEGVAKDLVTRFKSGGQSVLGRLMAELACDAFSEFLSNLPAGRDALVTWVPAHKSTIRERGYNQAEILARRLAGLRPGSVCCPTTLKVRGTRHQKVLGRADRAGNLRGAFQPIPGVERRLESVGEGREASRPSAIVLVDDVYTTGATASAVSSVLVSATGLPVHVFTFSRAVSAVGEGHD